jgi:hypothetical protein
MAFVLKASRYQDGFRHWFFVASFDWSHNKAYREVCTTVFIDDGFASPFAKSRTDLTHAAANFSK